MTGTYKQSAYPDNDIKYETTRILCSYIDANVF